MTSDFPTLTCMTLHLAPVSACYEDALVLWQVFRRFQWLFVRLEVELRKIQAQRADMQQLVPPAYAPAHSKVDVQHILDPAPSGILPPQGLGLPV